MTGENLNDLTALVAVAEERSFTRAASRRFHLRPDRWQGNLLMRQLAIPLSALVVENLTIGRMEPVRFIEEAAAAGFVADVEALEMRRHPGCRADHGSPTG